MEKIDGNVHTIPVGEGQPKHEENADCWCGPDLIDDFTNHGGKKLYLHKEIQ